MEKPLYMAPTCVCLCGVPFLVWSDGRRSFLESPILRERNRWMDSAHTLRTRTVQSRSKSGFHNISESADSVSPFAREVAHTHIHTHTHTHTHTYTHTYIHTHTHGCGVG